MTATAAAYAIGFGALFVAGLWVFYLGRKVRRGEEAREELRAIEEAEAIRRRVDGMSDDELDDELRKHR